MIILYTNVKDFTERRGKGWCIFHVHGEEKNDLKGAFVFFLIRDLMHSFVAILAEVCNVSYIQCSEMYCTPYRTNTKVSTLERRQSNQFSEITKLLWLMLYNSRQNDPTLNSRNDVKSEMEHTE